MKHLSIIVLCLAITFSFVQDVFAKIETIAEGKMVRIEYTLKVDGTVIESTDDIGPLDYVAGEGNLVPGLAKALIGLKEGDEKSIVVAPQDAYGTVREDAIRELPINTFPEGFTPEQGLVIEFNDPQTGQKVPCIVWEVKEETVVLNFNHPLAGKELHYDVKVVKIEEPIPAEDIEEIK